MARARVLAGRARVAVAAGGPCARRRLLGAQRLLGCTLCVCMCGIHSHHTGGGVVGGCTSAAGRGRARPP